MKYEEYRDIYNKVLLLDEDFKTIMLPVEVMEGESEDEAFMRFLLNMDMIEIKGTQWRIKDRQAIQAYNPNLLKLLDAMVMSKMRAEFDELEEIGFVYMTADDNGNIIYELTEEGKAHAEDD